MGYWVNTTYINHGTIADVEQAMDTLFASEGMERIPPPKQRERLLVEPMQYDNALNNDLWGLALFSGAPSWTVVQTAPLELLSERAISSPRMRLADLCRHLSASAFQLNVYDSTGVILAEISKLGECFVSGMNFQADNPFEWSGEVLDETFIDAQFRLHPFQELIADAQLGDDYAEILAKHFGGDNSAFCDNIVSVDTLICHKPFTAPGGVALYYRWQGATRQRFSPHGSWENYRSAVRGR